MDETAASVLGSSNKEMMLSTSEESSVDVPTEVPLPYLDPAFRKRRTYERIIGKLYLGHLVDFTQEPKEHAGLFFVKKKDVRLRLIVDGRPANARFRRLPSVPMGGSSSWAEVALKEDQTMFVGTHNVKAYFYTLGIDPELGKCFCLRR